MTWISPNTFEHLTCDLLQCEYPNLRWWNIGGSGDGGVDIIGMNSETGDVSAVVQCKWFFEGSVQALGEEVRSNIEYCWGKAVVYVAVLFGGNNQEPLKGVSFLSRRTLAELLLKHRGSCTVARALGVGAQVVEITSGSAPA